MGVSWVKAAQNFSNAAQSLGVSFTATNANDLVIVMSDSGSTVPTWTISASGAGWSTVTWNVLIGKTTTTGTNCESWWTFAPNTNATTITVTASGSGNQFMSCLVDEFTGMDGTSPIAGTNSGVGSGTPSITVTPTVDNCQVWGGCMDSITAVGSGYTKGADDTQQDWSEHLTTALGAGTANNPKTVNFSGSGTWLLMAAAIKPPASTASFEDDSFKVILTAPIDPTITVWQRPNA